MLRLTLIAVLAATPMVARAQTAPQPQIEPGAATQTGLDAWQAPTLTITRYDEHWTLLSDPAVRDEHWTGPFKYIPIGSETWATTGLEVRARYEDYRGNNWGSPPAPDNGYLWLRALPYADVHAGTGPVGVRAFAQPVIAYAVGVKPAPSPIDQTRVDMLQAFGDIRIGAETGASQGFGATARIGRQLVSLGDERLVGTRYGPNVMLTFDGLRGLLSLGGVTLTLLDVRPVNPGPHSFDDVRSPTKKLWGAYAVLHKPRVTNVDLYYLDFHNDVATFGGVTGRERRQSVGLRLWGARSGWHWDVEGIAQFGQFTGQRIRAWAFGSDFGKTLASLPLSPDLGMRFNVVSGDGRPGDGRLGTFEAPFPRGKYFGELSPVGPANIVNVNPRITAKIAPRVSASLAGMAYWRYSTGDGIYGVPGNLLRAPGGSTARFIGKQAESLISWQATPELELSASLSFFEPGAFIRETGPARAIRMIGTEANFRF